MLNHVTEEESEPLYQTLIKAIKTHRLARNMTQQEVVKGTGLSLTTVRRFELGEEVGTIEGDIPEYLHALDGVGWKRMILAYAVPNSEAAQAQKRRMQGYAAPTWAQHFVVESLLASFEEVG